MHAKSKMKIFLVVVVLGVAHGWFPVKTKMEWKGKWGDWGMEQKCDNDYATGFKVRVEGKQGSGDDTALNSVCLICKGNREICSSVGFWGNWYRSFNCLSGYTGGMFRFEQPIDGDDTAGNTLLLNCGTPKNFVGAKGAPDNWGSWSTQHCRRGTRICGLQTRVEAPIDGDDTALNGIRFTCCATVVQVKVFLLTLIQNEAPTGSDKPYRIEKNIQSGVKYSAELDVKVVFDILNLAKSAVSYAPVNGDAGYLRGRFMETMGIRSSSKTETIDFLVSDNKPLYVYQLRGFVLMSDRSTIEIGSPNLVQRQTPINKRNFILWESLAWLYI